MPAQRSNQSLLLELQDNLSADLFASAVPLRLAADEALFLAGDTGDGCYLVEEGLLKVVVASHSGGGERILAFLGRGAIVGEMSVVDGRPRSASVMAVRQAALKFLSRASFEEFTNKYPDVYKYLMKLLASRLREANAVIAAGTFLSLKGRVARTLLELAEGFGQDVGSGRIVIHQKIGQSDLAAMAGIARANVSRIINEWKRQKLVSRLSGYYCLENRTRLESESEM
jgi:CRP-like cAMP-binding protein